MNKRDVVVIGGGFYGCITALNMKRKGFDVLLLERDNDLLLRASYANQARVHNGYHYPRSFMTAWRSVINFPRFVLDFKDCIDNSFEKVYAIARQNSKVNPHQFKQFCHHIGAPIQQAPYDIKQLFNPHYIEDVFIVKEYAFNAVRLREIVHKQLLKSKVDIAYQSNVHCIERNHDHSLVVHLDNGQTIDTRYVFNCSYAQLNVILKNSHLNLLPLKHQVSEITLVKVPEQLKEIGITVMDGPFFSIMPFPADNLHSLSHVRYTHHETWVDDEGFQNPYQRLESRNNQTNFPFMIRDAQRYLPILEQVQYAHSLFEIKTLLLQNEIDDGRPILFHQSSDLTGLYNVLGGKIDNIFDLMGSLKELFNQVVN